MTESKDPRLSEEQVKAAFFSARDGGDGGKVDFAKVADAVTALIEATPAPKPSEGFVVTDDALRTALDEFRANLIAMTMLEAPPAPASQPVSAPAEKKEWVTEGMASAVFSSGREWREALNELLAPRIETHIAAALGNSTCHQAMCRDELLWRASIELAEVRAALKEAKWWEHLSPDCTMPYSENHNCLYCQRIAELRAREAELQGVQKKAGA